MMLTPSTQYANRISRANSPPNTVPAETPPVIAAPTTPEATPRSLGGRRSAITVMIGVCIELREIEATSQVTVIAAIPCAYGTRMSAPPPIKAPSTIQGVLRPNRDRVRSERAPERGVIVVLKTDVMAKRTPRLVALPA